MSTSSFRAAAAQMCSGSDLRANLSTCRLLAEKANRDNAQLLVLPENFAFLGRHEQDKLAVAEAITPANPGPILAALLDMAADYDLWILAGGMPEALPPGAGESRTYNTAVVVTPERTVAATYRKIHLFDVDIPGRATLKESSNTAAGTQIVTAETPWAKIGLSICYDLRFPELYRQLTKSGAHVLAVPAAFTAHTGAAHWATLLRARAIENQTYVIAAAQTGRHNDKRQSYGHSTIIDPWGDICARLPSGDGIITADISIDRIHSIRQQMPCLDHRRL